MNAFTKDNHQQILELWSGSASSYDKCKCIMEMRRLDKGKEVDDLDLYRILVWSIYDQKDAKQKKNDKFEGK